MSFELEGLVDRPDGIALQLLVEGIRGARHLGRCAIGEFKGEGPDEAAGPPVAVVAVAAHMVRDIPEIERPGVGEQEARLLNPVLVQGLHPLGEGDAQVLTQSSGMLKAME